MGIVSGYSYNHSDEQQLLLRIYLHIALVGFLQVHVELEGLLQRCPQLCYRGCMGVVISILAEDCRKC